MSKEEMDKILCNMSPNTVFNVRDTIALAALTGDWASQNPDQTFSDDASLEALQVRARLYFLAADAFLSVRKEPQTLPVQNQEV